MGSLQGFSNSFAFHTHYLFTWLIKIILCLFFSMATLVFAEPENACDRCEPPRFSAYEPNYAVYRWSENDERAIRTHLAFKYDFRPLNAYPDAPLFNRFNRWDFYFSYVGEFDFYIDSRYSSPVINRINNPAFHWQRDVGNAVSVNLSLEHKSNGQTDEVVSPEEIAAATIAYEQNDHRFFDTISRGSNYGAIEMKQVVEALKTDFYVKGKIYLMSDFDITWMGEKGKDLSIEDYDRLTLVARSHFGSGEASIDLTLGDQLFDTESWNVDYVPSRKIPIFYLRYHHGPLYTLSNYTLSEQYFGLGIKFIP